MLRPAFLRYYSNLQFGSDKLCPGPAFIRNDRISLQEIF